MSVCFGVEVVQRGYTNTRVDVHILLLVRGVRVECGDVCGSAIVVMRMGPFHCYMRHEVRGTGILIWEGEGGVLYELSKLRQEVFVETYFVLLLLLLSFSFFIFILMRPVLFRRI